MATGPNQEQNYVSPASIGQQVDSLHKSIGNTMEQAGGAISSAVGDLTKSLTKAGTDLGNSIKQSISKVSGIAPTTKFPDTFINKTVIPEDPPERSRAEKSGPLQYPSDIPDKFIKFTFKAFYQDGPIFKRKEITQRSIILPIPGDLVERYGVTYAEKQLGMLGVLQDSGMLQSVAQSSALDENTARAIGQNMGGALNTGNMAGLALNSSAGRSALAAVSSEAGNAVERATGTVLNPYQALQFTGVELRSHSFKYKFSPNSLDESRTVKEIIREFKLRMLPEKTGLMFNFPDVCTIEFSGRDRQKALYYFKNCYLKSMNVNYAPNGTPSFFIGGQYPTEIELTLDFGEIEPVTRNDIIDGDDYTGKYGAAIESPKNIPETPAR